MGNNCCIRGSNNNNELLKENQELKKKLDDYEKKKIDEKEIDIEKNMDQRSIGSGTSHSTLGYQKNIRIKYEGNEYNLNVKNKDSLSKVLDRFKNKIENCNYEGICRYKGNQCKLSKTIEELNIQEGEIIELS